MQPADMIAAQNWLRNHGIAECPVCRSGPLEVKPQIGALVPLAAGRVVLDVPGVPLMPVVSVMCKNCSYVMIFGAHAMGINP